MALKSTTSKRAPSPRTKAQSAPAKRPSAAVRARAIVAALKKAGSAAVRTQMAEQFGIRTPRALGIKMGVMHKIAKAAGRDQALAEALWQTGWYEARTVAVFVAEPAAVSVELMDQWAADFDNWGICDTACFHLFDRTPHALGRIRAWSNRKEEFVRRAAFALLASISLHDKKLSDAPLLALLPRCERAATDPRNFVKKGVVWALRGIGRRNATLHAAALAVAERLAQHSNSAARWVGTTARRELIQAGPRIRAKA